jgi:hypothetical protein
MVYHDVKQRTRSDSIYSEFNEEDYDDGDVSEAVKPQGAATFASYMNLTNTCIGAVSHSSTPPLTHSLIHSFISFHSATFASYMNLTNTRIGAVSFTHSLTHSPRPLARMSPCTCIHSSSHSSTLVTHASNLFHVYVLWSLSLLRAAWLFPTLWQTAV